MSLTPKKRTSRFLIKSGVFFYYQLNFSKYTRPESKKMLSGRKNTSPLLNIQLGRDVDFVRNVFQFIELLIFAERFSKV